MLFLLLQGVGSITLNNPNLITTEEQLEGRIVSSEIIRCIQVDCLFVLVGKRGPEKVAFFWCNSVVSKSSISSIIIKLKLISVQIKESKAC